MSRSVKRTMDGVVRMLKGVEALDWSSTVAVNLTDYSSSCQGCAFSQVVGNQIYHSVGDNPEDSSSRISSKQASAWVGGGSRARVSLRRNVPIRQNSRCSDLIPEREREFTQ